MHLPATAANAAQPLNSPQLEQMVENSSPGNAPAESPSAQDRREAAIAGVRVGHIASLAVGGAPLVDFPGNPAGAAVAAQTTTRLAPRDLGRSVVLMFEDGSPGRPVIVGLLEPSPMALDPGQLTVEADGRRVMVTADQELVLRCGKASITLTQAGKVILRGAYLLSRSSGVNRIKGGSVQIN